jgi:hypothetical protein
MVSRYVLLKKTTARKSGLRLCRAQPGSGRRLAQLGLQPVEVDRLGAELGAELAGAAPPLIVAVGGHIITSSSGKRSLISPSNCRPTIPGPTD